jgi:AcrR family transcriptional regulator
MPDAAEQGLPGAAAPRKGRTHRFDHRRGEIADTAARLFAKQGYHATSIQDITDATNLQRGALYHYIDGKKDLLYEIHSRFIYPVLLEARRIEAEEVQPDVALRRVADALMRTLTDYRDQITVFLHEWKVISDDEEWAEVRTLRRDFECVIERLVERGVAMNMFSVPHVGLAARAYLGMINYTYQWLDVEGSWNPEDVAAYFADLFIRGISVRGDG